MLGSSFSPDPVDVKDDVVPIEPDLCGLNVRQLQARAVLQPDSSEKRKLFYTESEKIIHLQEMPR